MHFKYSKIILYPAYNFKRDGEGEIWHIGENKQHFLLLEVKCWWKEESKTSQEKVNTPISKIILFITMCQHVQRTRLLTNCSFVRAGKERCNIITEGCVLCDIVADKSYLSLSRSHFSAQYKCIWGKRTVCIFFLLSSTETWNLVISDQFILCASQLKF